MTDKKKWVGNGCWVTFKYTGPNSKTVTKSKFPSLGGQIASWNYPGQCGMVPGLLAVSPMCPSTGETWRHQAPAAGAWKEKQFRCLKAAATVTSAWQRQDGSWSQRISHCLPTSRSLCSLWGALLLASPCLSSPRMSPTGSSSPPATLAHPRKHNPGSWWQTRGESGENRENNERIRKCAW